MPEIAALARRVKAYRQQMGMSQLKMSEVTGVSVEEISLIEREKVNDLKLSTVQKFAAYMDITVSDLLLVEERDCKNCALVLAGFASPAAMRSP